MKGKVNLLQLGCRSRNDAKTLEKMLDALDFDDASEKTSPFRRQLAKGQTMLEAAIQADAKHAAEIKSRMNRFNMPTRCRICWN